MAKLSITIDSEDDGINDYTVSELVHNVARKLLSGQEGGKILSHNGNTVGKWKYERTEEEDVGEEEEELESSYTEEDLSNEDD
jgi:hypothetical protein